MRKKVILIFLALGTLSVRAEIKVEKNKKTLADGKVEEYLVTKENNPKVSFEAGTPRITLEKGLELNKNSKLLLKGDIKEKAEKGVLALEHYGKSFSDKGIKIKEGGILDINVKLKDSGVYYPNYPLIGMKTYSNRNKGIRIEKGGALNVLVHSNRTLERQTNINAPHKENRDLFHQLYYSSIGLELGEDLTSNGNINIESTGWGISYNEKKVPKKIEFEKGSETNIKAGLIGLYQPKDETTVNFKEGSYAKLIGGMYGLVSRKVEFEKGSKIDAYGKYGLGNFEYKGYGDKYYFKKGSEVNILANRAALYSISLQEGETKLNAKAKNVFQQVDTRHEKTQNLDTFTVGKGSILEGNIEESWNAKIKLDEETKLFVNDKVDTNLIAKGDIYVGPRTAYEKVENKVYEKEVKKQLGNIDATVGASVILLGDLSKQNLDDLKSDELDDHFGKPRDIHPFPEVDPNKYYTVKFNDYDYNSDDRKIKVNFDDTKVHLRVGKEKDGETNDKLIFSKITTVEGKGANIVLHPDTNVKVKRNTVFELLEEDLTGKKESGLAKLSLKINDLQFGKYAFTRRSGRTGDKYVVSSLYKGIDTQDFTKKFEKEEEDTNDVDKFIDGNIEGSGNTSKGKTSSAFGSYNIAKNSSSAFGRVNTAEGNFSSAFGGNNIARGEGSSAFGTTNVTSGIHSVAFGNGNTTNGEKSSIFGVGNIVTGEKSTAVGYKNTIGGNNNFVLGNNVEVGAGLDNVVVLGNNSEVGTSNTVSVGSATNQRKIIYVAAGADDTDAVNLKQHKNAENIDTTAWKSKLGIGSAPKNSGVKNTAIATGSLGLGHDNIASGNYSTAIGYKNKVTGNSSGAFGDPNIVSGNGSYAFGNDNVIDGNNNFILGNNVKIKKEINNSVALGNKSTVSSSNEVSVGSETQKRKITNVADGEVSATSTDVVNGRQLHEVSKQVEVVKELKNDISNVKKETRGIGSLSAALSALHPMQYDKKAPNQIMAGVGSYRDKQAVAVGVTHYFKENVMMTAGLALSNESKTNAMANLGLTWKLGKNDSNTETIPQYTVETELRRITKENSDLKSKIQSQDEKIRKQEIKMKNLEEKLEMLLKK